MRVKSKSLIERSFKVSSLWDHHGHITMLGGQSEKINCLKVSSPEKLYLLLKKEAARKGDGEWIFGYNLNMSLWGNRNSNIEIIDRVTPNNPLLIERVDAHSAVINSLTLKKVSLNLNEEIKGGFFEKANERYTGGVVDGTFERIMSYFSDSPPHLIEKRIKKAQVILKKNFLTGATDMMVTEAESQVYWQMECNKKLILPVVAFLKWSKDKNIPANLFKGKMYIEEGIKVFIDGALGSRGASLKSSYSDDRENYGVLLLDKKEIADLIEECNKKNINIAFHIIGDRALENFIEGYEVCSPLNIKIRLEHLQVTPPPLLKRLRKLDLILSLQPSHFLSDRKWAIKRLGKERLEYSYLLKSLIKGKKTYLFGTDFPIEPPNIKRTLRACLKRNKFEEIDILEALKGMKAPDQFSKFSKPCIISVTRNNNFSGIEIKYFDE